MWTRTEKRKEKSQIVSIRSKPSKIPWVAAVFLAALIFTPMIAGAATPAGTEITNIATATWTDNNANSYSQASLPTTVMVLSLIHI